MYSGLILSRRNEPCENSAFSCFCAPWCCAWPPAEKGTILAACGNQGTTDDDIAGDDWRTWGTIQDTGTLTHDGQMIDVCICITDTGADLYYDKAEQELYTTVQFPVPLDSAASRYQGTDYSDLDGDGNSDLQMSFDQDGEYVTYVWYWNTVRGEFMDTLAD